MKFILFIYRAFWDNIGFKEKLLPGFGTVYLKRICMLECV